MYHHNKILKKFFVSYIIIIILSSLTVGSTYLMGKNIIEEIALFGHKAALEQFSENVYHNFSHIQRSSSFIHQFVNRSLPFFSWESIQNKIYLKEMIKSFELPFDNVKAVLYSDDIVLDLKYIYNREEFYNFFIKNANDIDFQDWDKTVTDSNYNKIMPVNYSVIGGEKTEKIESLLFITSNYMDVSRQAIKLLFFIDLVHFDNLVKNGHWLALGDVFLVTGENKVLYSNSYNDNNYNIPDIDSREHFTHEGMTYLVKDLGINNLKVITRYSNYYFEQQERLLMFYALAFLVFLIITGSVLSLIFSRHQYSPIQNIKNILKNYNSIDSSIVIHEDYKFIQDGIQKIIEEKNSMLSILETQQKNMTQVFLGRVIENHYAVTNEELEEKFLQWDLVVEKDNYCVLSIDLQKNIDLSLSETLNLFKKEIKPIVNCPCWTALTSSHMVLVLFGDEDFSSILNKKLESYRNHMEFLLNTNLNIGVSSIHNDLTYISELYIQSLIMLEKKDLTNSSCFFWNNLKEKKKNTAQCLPYFKKYCNAIDVRDYDLFSFLVNQHLEEIFSDKNTSFFTMKSNLVGLINIVIECISQIEIQIGQDLSEEKTILENLFISHSFSHVLNDIKKVLDNVVRISQNNILELSTESIVDTVKEIVAENLFNQQLGVNFVAEKINWTASKLSLKFKSTNGIGLLEYIHVARINESKTILKETDLAIKDISDKVGYWNSNTFIKIFKKYEGITPGQYRSKTN